MKLPSCATDSPKHEQIDLNMRPRLGEVRGEGFFIGIFGVIGRLRFDRSDGRLWMVVQVDAPCATSKRQTPCCSQGFGAELRDWSANLIPADGASSPEVEKMVQSAALNVEP